MTNLRPILKGLSSFDKLQLVICLTYITLSDERVDPLFHATARHTTLLNLSVK